MTNYANIDRGKLHTPKGKGYNLTPRVLSYSSLRSERREEYEKNMGTRLGPGNSPAYGFFSGSAKAKKNHGPKITPPPPPQ